MSKIDYQDFEKVNIRIGTVVEAEVPEWSHWVMKLKVDFGKKLGKRISFAGIMRFFQAKELLGRQFPFVVNLKPKTVGPNKELSECMMIMAVEKDDEKIPPVLLRIDQKVKNGTRVI